MTALIVIFGVLLIIAGVALMVTPLMTFMSAGYFIIILFFLWGIYGFSCGVFTALSGESERSATAWSFSSRYSA